MSLLPDCLASKLSSTLPEVEEAVVRYEDAAGFEAASDGFREDVTLPSAVRWLRRRVVPVRAALTTLIGLRPDVFAGCESTIESFRARLGVECALVALRAHAAGHLAVLPPPLGFGPRPLRRRGQRHRRQHEAGPDPPSPAR